MTTRSGGTRLNKQGYALIGYHLADLPFALRLSADLKGRGVNVWMDRLDIRPGEDWMRVEMAALRDCTALIALLTPDYVTSPYGQDELESVYNSGRPLVPLLLRHVSASDWPVQVNYHDYIDFTRWQQDAFYQQALEQVISQIEALPVVAVTGLVNPEKRYITQLTARIEQHRASFDYVRLSYKVRADQQEQSALRPPPRLETSWGLNGPFYLRYAPLTDPRPIASLNEALDLYPRFMLEGVSGVGKTTTLHRLVMDSAADYLEDPRQNPLPFLVSLAAWPEELSFADFLRSQWPLKSNVQERIARRDLALYLDGLDEIGAEADQRLESLRSWLNSDQSPERVIITTASGVFPDGANLNLPIIRMEEMNSARSAQFVRLVLGEEGAEAFWKKPESERSACILRNPLLLRVALFIHQHTAEAVLPDALGPLLLRATELLWQREQILQGADCPPYEDLVEDLSALALEIAQRGSGAILSRDQVRQRIRQDELIDSLISAGILLLSSGGLRFAHQLLQQSLAARHFVQESVHPYLGSPAFDRSGLRTQRRWDPVIVAAMTLLEHADVTLEEIADVDPFLALECLIAGASALPATQHDILARLLHSTRQEYQAGADAAMALLAAQTPEDPTSSLLALLRQGDWQLRSAANDLVLLMNRTSAAEMLESLNHWDGSEDSAVASSFRQLGPVVLLPLLHMVRDADAARRRAAAWALGQMRDPAAVPSLVVALGDEDAKVREAAAASLVHLPDSQALPALLPLLQDSSKAVRKAVIAAVARLGAAGVPELRRWIQNLDVNAQRMAVGTLRHIADPVVVPELADCLEVEDIETRAIAVRALGELGGKQAVRSLEKHLKDEEVSNWTQKTIGVMAQEALEQIGTEDAMTILQRFRLGKDGAEPISSAQTAVERMKIITAETPRPAPRSNTSKVLEALRSPEERNRLRAVKALSESGKVKALSPLADALQDTSPRVRIAAVKGLANFPADHVVEHLLDALRDPEATVVEIAMQHLSQIGPTALDSLIDLLQSQLPALRGLAAEILGIIGDPRAVPHLEALLRDSEIVSLRNRSVGQLASDALERIGSPQQPAGDAVSPILVAATMELVQTASSEDLETLASLIQGLQSAEWRERRDAARQFMKFARSLRERSHAGLVEPMLGYLSIEDEFVRSALIDALAYIVDPASIPALRRLLSTADWMQRIVILRALAQMNDPEVGQALIVGLSDSQDRVRETAAEMLGLHAYEGAVPALRQALKDPALFVRRFAIQSLGRLQAREAVNDLLPFLNSGNREMRATTVEALGRMGAAEAVPFLSKQLHDGGEIVMDTQKTRRFSDLVLEALATIHTPEAQKVIQHYQARQGKR